MFGADTSNNQAQSTTLSTTSDVTSPLVSNDAPIISSTTPPIGLGETVTPDVSTPEDTSTEMSRPDIPEFIPPDSDGNINQTVVEKEEAPKPASNLADIKKEALTKLGPLVDKLDQEPVDKFKTLMMMIQASDDQSLITKAYEAANAITDETEKARALLDIVNEINYFTTQSAEPSSTTL